MQRSQQGDRHNAFRVALLLRQSALRSSRADLSCLDRSSSFARDESKICSLELDKAVVISCMQLFKLLRKFVQRSSMAPPIAYCCTSKP